MSLEAADQWLTEHADEMLATLVRWCNQNSGSYAFQELHQMAQLLCGDWDAKGIPLLQEPLPSTSLINDDGSLTSHQTGPALTRRLFPERSRQVLLAIHYDTVYPPESPFQTCTTLDDGSLRGPGVVDAKGGLVILFYALQAVRRFGIANGLGLRIVLNPDEEIGAPASASLLQRECAGCEAGFLFEPALPDGSLAAARRGTGNFTFVCRGRSAHAGRNPEYGRNAISQVARVIQAIEALNCPSDGITINFGRITGGSTALNQVPDLAIARCNVRVSQQEHATEIKERFRGIVEQFSGDGFECRVDGEFLNPPKQIDGAARRLQGVVERAAKRMGAEIAWKDTGGACDGNKVASFGVPNIDTLGPRGGDLHSNTEWMQPMSLVTKSQLLVSTLAQLEQDGPL